MKNCNTNVWIFIFKYVLKAKYVAFLLITAFIASAFLIRFQTWIIAQMIGMLSDAPVIIENLIKYFAGFVTVLLLNSAIDYLRRRSEAYFIPFASVQLSKDLFTMVHRQSARFFEEEMSGNISGKINNISANVQNMYFYLLHGTFIPLIQMGISLGFIAYANSRLGLILGGLNLAFMVITLYFHKKIVPYAQIRSNYSTAANGILVDSVTNSTLVKSFANYFYEKRRYFNACRTAAQAQKKEMLKESLIRWLSQSIFDIMTIISYALTFYSWYKHSLSIADVILITSMITSLISSIHSMGYVASGFAQVYGNLRDGLELLQRPCEVTDAPDAVNLNVKHADIKFDKISYCYKNNKPLFKNFSLNIGEGEKIGLVGHSGSGKSTLIKLLLRYYNLQSGKICISGQDISKVRQESLRKNIAIIPQESTLFNRSIMENIRYGNPKASDRQVIAAAKKAYIHDFIMSLPHQYESKVGERGVMLSGGERQRIAIARAILKNAPILILDEATSALDSQSEQYIQKSLKILMQNKTVIAIAHRLSTLQEMDKLVVINKGKIIETGSHQDLIAAKGVYHDFYRMQSIEK